MKDPWAELREQVAASVEAAVKKCRLGAKNLDIPSTIEKPPTMKMGDLACSVAFQIGTLKKKNPRRVAEALIEKVKKPAMFKKVALAGAYVNFFLDRGKFAKRIITDAQKEKYGEGEEKEDKIMVEFSQVNTHKVFHIGHIRGTILGEDLSRILEKAGYEVVRANYQGDVGSHVAKWLWNYMKFHKGEEPHGNKGMWLANMYAEACTRLIENPDYEAEVSETLQKLEGEEDEELNEIWKKTRQWSLDEYEKIYKELDVRFDRYFFESEMEKRGKEIVEELRKKKLAKRSKGAVVIDLKKYDLDIFLLLKSDGTSLYSTKDLALAEKKFKEYKIDRSIHVIGSEQRLYFQQLFKMFEVIGFKKANKCYHLAYNLVNLRGGKMSSREGTAILYSDVRKKILQKALEEVLIRNPEIYPLKQREIAEQIAIGAMKYDMLKVNSNKTIFFDWEQALEFEGETAPYIQYAGVRAKRILEKAKKMPSKVDYKNLKEIAEHDLIKQIAFFSGVVASAAEEYKPSLIANYCYRLADRFSVFYNQCQVLDAKEKEVKEARLALVAAFYNTLELGLELLGIEIPERM